MLLERKEVYYGRIVDLVVDTIEVNGRTAIREVVRHPGGVVVLAQREDGRIPFVRQTRYPMQQSLLELPAGKVDAGEAPLTSAARELEEETGLRPDYLDHVSSFYSSPGFCDELLHLYYTDSVRMTSHRLEHDEDIVVEWHTPDEAIDLCVRGDIVDAKTLLAMFWLDWRRRQSVRRP
jgi:ADP-ribose pyrophosphatase